jgi:threonine/homoserine/homoserine lactone efflux protein
MTTDQILAFLLFAIAAAGTPGPSNVLLLATGARVGVVRGFPCLLGVSGGMGIMMFAVALGLGTLVVDSPRVLGTLNWLGAGFLLWLAWKIGSAGAITGSSEDKPVGFFGAAAFQWVNPKSWLVCVSAAGTYLQPDAGSAFYQSAMFGGLFVAASFPACVVWLSFGAALKNLLRTPRATRIFNVSMGLLLAASVVLILW